MLNITPLAIKDVLLLEYTVKEDNRGISQRMFSKAVLEQAGIITEFVEDILYCPAKKGTLYGIHFQNHPKAQTKLLYCLKGRGLDFAVDLRHQSPTYKQWVCTELSSDKRTQIYIPPGFGHAFVSLEDETKVMISIDQYFDIELQRAIWYADPELGLDVPFAHPILSPQDINAPLFRESDCNL